MSDSQERRRTVTRLRAEAPPGLTLSSTEGQKVIGRYEVIKTLGKGAMGVVYKARDPLLDRVVAVKTISAPPGAGRRSRAAFLERFQREAKAAAKMQHPAIVTIFDVGIDEASGAPFMVLEYLPGESLADRLDRVRFPLGRAVQISLDLASALAFAHRQRIVHRDVKPANVLHAGEHRWKLADFGIARTPDSDLTQVGIFMGTPGYSPPEAIREGHYTAQADVFAWGACVYELVTGRIPYEGPDTRTTNGYVVAGTAPPPTKYDASVPEPLVRVIMAALDPSPATRYKDASEAEAALREAWDRCLGQGLVHPWVLVADELSHDKAPAKMHAARGANAMPVSVHGDMIDTAELTSSDAELPPRGRLAVAAAVAAAVPVADGDDDPTTILMRDDLLRSKPPIARLRDDADDSVVQPPPRPSAPVLPATPAAVAPVEPDDSDASTVPRKAIATGRLARDVAPRSARPAPRSGSNGVTLALVILAIIVAVGVAVVGAGLVRR